MADVGFFLLLLSCFPVRDLFSSECRHIYHPPPFPHPPRPAPMLFVPTHNSFFNASDTELFEISAHLNLISLQFSGLLLDFLFFFCI